MLLEKFQPKDGPFYQTLDPALAQLHVEWQAYHGGTFVSNHVLKLLKVQNRQHTVDRDKTQVTPIHTTKESFAEVLCLGIVPVAHKKCPDLLPLTTKRIHTSPKFFACMPSATVCSMGSCQ